MSEKKIKENEIPGEAIEIFNRNKDTEEPWEITFMKSFHERFYKPKVRKSIIILALIVISVSMIYITMAMLMKW